MSRQYPSSPQNNPKKQPKSAVPHLPSYYGTYYDDRTPDVPVNRIPMKRNSVPKRGLSRKRSSTSLNRNETEELYIPRQRLKAGDINSPRPPYPTITFKIVTPSGGPSSSPGSNLNYTQSRDRSPNSYPPVASGHNYRNSVNHTNYSCAPNNPQPADNKRNPPDDRIWNLTVNDPSAMPQIRCESCCRNHGERYNDMYETQRTNQQQLPEECDDPRKGAGGQIAELPPNFLANAPLHTSIFDSPYSNNGPNSYPPTTSKAQPVPNESEEDVCIRPPRQSAPKSSSRGSSFGNEIALYNPAAQENRLMRLQQSQDLSAGTRLLRETLSRIKTPEDIEEACELIRRGVDAQTGACELIRRGVDAQTGGGGGGTGGGCCGGGKKNPAAEESTEKPKVCKAKSNLTEVLGVTMKGMDNIVQTLKKASGTSEILNVPGNANESNKILAKQLLGSQENIDELKRELQNLLREMQKLLSNYV